MTVNFESCQASGSPWVFITGGVHADIGKGSLAAVLGRVIAKNSALHVEYMKIDPSLEESSISNYSNTRFGEIVRGPRGNFYDADVARASFYVPGFYPKPSSHISLRRLLQSIDMSQPKVSLGQCLGNLIGHARASDPDKSTDEEHKQQPCTKTRISVDVRVIEVGGTAGMPFVSRQPSSKHYRAYRGVREVRHYNCN